MRSPEDAASERAVTVAGTTVPTPRPRREAEEAAAMAAEATDGPRAIPVRGETSAAARPVGADEVAPVAVGDRPDGAQPPPCYPAETGDATVTVTRGG